MSLRGRYAKTSVTPTLRFLLVTVGGVRFAVQADHVQGLLTAEEGVSVDAVTVQGLTYTNIHVATRLQLTDDPLGPETRIVLLSKGHARGHVRVSRVHGLTELDQSQVLPLPRQFQSEEQKWYQGMILFEDAVALVLNSAWMIEECDAVHPIERRTESTQFLAVRPALAGGQV